MTIETRSLNNFSKVKLEGNAELILNHGESSAITIETDPEVFEHLKVEVENGVLVLGFISWLDAMLHGWKKVKYTLTYRQLDSLSISGAGKIYAQQLESEQFQFKISGSGNLLVDSLKTSRLNVRISGAASLNLSGSATQQDIQISGSAKMEAWSLDSQSARVQISGSGELQLKVSDSLKVEVSGSGSVRYLGSPQVSQSIQGSGSVKPMS